jgi:hypothetical protein
MIRARRSGVGGLNANPAVTCQLSMSSLALRLSVHESKLLLKLELLSKDDELLMPLSLEP